MTVSPAYGRDYKSKKEVLADWNNGKDFVIESVFGGDAGRYVSKKDLPAGTSVSIRYKRMTQVVVVQV